MLHRLTKSQKQTKCAFKILVSRLDTNADLNGMARTISFPVKCCRSIVPSGRREYPVLAVFEKQIKIIAATIATRVARRFRYDDCGDLSVNANE